MRVETFDFEKLNKLIKESDPYIQQYIKALLEVVEMQKHANNKAMKKIFELSNTK